LECTNETDFSGKEFLDPTEDKTVKAGLGAGTLIKIMSF
jgi:hypothetical protein